MTAPLTPAAIASLIASLDQDIASADSDLRTWRKANSTEWHDDPDYAAQAQRLAGLRRRRTRLARLPQAGIPAEGG